MTVHFLLQMDLVAMLFILFEKNDKIVPKNG